jgi:predicted nucleic acid-binding protein
VLVEVDWLCSRTLRPDTFVRFLADVHAGSARVVDLTASDYARALELLTRYADLKLGFVDAAVIVVAERLDEPRVATLDHRHFAPVRPRHTTALALLPDG